MKNGLAYEINEVMVPSMAQVDFHLEDSWARPGSVVLSSWISRCRALDLSYVARWQEHRPVMIHRAIYGSLERFKVSD